MTDIYVSGDSPPAVKRLHRDCGFFAGLWGGSYVSDADFNLSQHRHDLLWLVPLEWHDRFSSQVDSLSFHLVQKWPVTSAFPLAQPANKGTVKSALRERLRQISIDKPRKGAGLSRHTILRARRGERVHPRTLQKIISTLTRCRLPICSQRCRNIGMLRKNKLMNS
jgi:hypothetical protein